MPTAYFNPNRPDREVLEALGSGECRAAQPALRPSAAHTCLASLAARLLATLCYPRLTWQALLAMMVFVGLSLAQVNAGLH